MKIYYIFYPNLLKLVTTDPLSGQCNPPPLFVVANKRKKKEWEVNNIIDAKKDQRGKVLFKVKWKGYNKDNQWYLAANFNHAREVVDDFYNCHPTKPRVTILKVANNNN